MKHKINILKTSLFISLISLSFATTSCNDKTKENDKLVQASEKITADFSLIGKTAIVTYPDLKVEVKYVSETTLHWKTISEKGKAVTGQEEDETIIYKKMTDNLYFLNWIEKDGFTISQILDTKNNVANTYLSYSDPTSKRGKRAGTFSEGKIEFLK